MSRADRRRFEREFEKRRKSLPDNCDICQYRFPHNSKTFGGITRDGTMAFVGECCEKKLQQIYVNGVYASKNFDHLLPTSGGSPKSPTTNADASISVEKVQSHFRSLDEQAQRVARNAGLKIDTPKVFLQSNAWKKDDAAWFKANPTRSHRRREMFEGELDASHPIMLAAQPMENHRVEILVRQVEVGQRVRTAFVRNMNSSAPDTEEVAHALFDMATQSEQQGVLSAEAIAAMVERYSSAFTGKPS